MYLIAKIIQIDDTLKIPDAIILRSFNMHDMEIDNNVKAIARAGAGVNNIPVSELHRTWYCCV